LLEARAGALTEWPGASAAGLVQPRSELCSSFRFAYPLDMLSIFFSALSVTVVYVRPGIVLESLDQKTRVFLVFIVLL
jgi:hypothetical protein